MSPDKNSEELHLNRPLIYAELAALSDELLLAQLKRGHNDALAVLFDRYYRLVMSIALRILRDAGEAEDLVQCVFLELFQSVRRFDPARGTAKVWILQYAYHRSFNRRQYLELRGLYKFAEELTPYPVTTDESYSQPVEAAEIRRTIKEALANLSKSQRKILELAFYEGLTMHEIAERTHRSFDSVRHHYYRGLEKLRSVLCPRPDTCLKSFSPAKRVHHAKS